MTVNVAPDSSMCDTRKLIALNELIINIRNVSGYRLKRVRILALTSEGHAN